jgi:hypothetical protein
MQPPLADRLTHRGMHSPWLVACGGSSAAAA